MPELPPPLPEFAVQQPPQSVPVAQIPSTPQRWSVQPLNDRVNCLIGFAVIFIVDALGLYQMVQEALRRGQIVQVTSSIFVQECITITAALLGSWMAIWGALSRTKLWIRLVVVAAIAFSFLGIAFMGERDEGYTAMYGQTLLMATVLNTYFLLMSFFRFRLARAHKLVFDHSTKNSFVLIPANSNPAEIEAFADWYEYRRSAGSGFMDIFRPVQFHLRQIFYVSLYVGALCLTVRGLIWLMFLDYDKEQFGGEFVTMIIIQLIGIFAPVGFAMLALAMWVSLGKRRLLLRFLILFTITFAIIFLYYFFTTLGITDLVIDFKLTWDMIQPIVQIFCVVSTWMIVARCLGYRLIRLPLMVNEKISSESNPQVQNAL